MTDLKRVEAFQHTQISIIIPVYNKSKYLNNIISDILKQTFTDYECILINDGSTDDSGEICDNITRTDNRFKVYHLKNGGVSAARNFGLDNAKGEYITFIDADDRLYPQYLENLYRCITENNVDMVISGIEKFWSDSDKKEFVLCPFIGEYNKSDILPQFAEVQHDTGIFGYTFSKIMKRSVLTFIKFDKELCLAEDFDFYLKVYKKINKIYIDDKCYYRYLQFAENSSSLVSDYDIDYFKQLIIRLRYRQFLIDEGVYTGENKHIVDNLINNYVYFVLFYAPVNDIRKVYDHLLNSITAEDLVLTEKPLFQKWILWLFKIKRPEFIKFSIWTYRKLASIKRKITN